MQLLPSTNHIKAPTLRKPGDVSCRAVCEGESERGREERDDPLKMIPEQRGVHRELHYREDARLSHDTLAFTFPTCVSLLPVSIN